MFVNGDVAQQALSSTHVPEERAASLLARVRRLAGRGLNDRMVAEGIVAALREVTEAVSSSGGVEGILDAIAGSARRVAEAEKAVVILTSDESGEIDVGTMVVRGPSSRHPQEWWLPRLDEISQRILASGTIAAERQPVTGSRLLCVPIRMRDRPIGVLAVINSAGHPFSSVHCAMLEVLAAIAASSVDNAIVSEEGRYVVVASERDRIARELHDGVVQSLFSVSLGLEVCKKQVARDPAGVGRRLVELQRQVNMSMSELRRFIYDLRPIRLGELGLAGAIGQWVRQVTSGKDMESTFVVTGERRPLTSAQESCLYRVAKEAVTNAVRHASASRIEVRIEYLDESVRLSVIDDGRGFDHSRAAKRRGAEGIGLRSIRERAQDAGGDLRIESASGAGTIVSVVLPVGGL